MATAVSPLTQEWSLSHKGPHSWGCRTVYSFKAVVLSAPPPSIYSVCLAFSRTQARMAVVTAYRDRHPAAVGLGPAHKVSASLQLFPPGPRVIPRCVI